MSDKYESRDIKGLRDKVVALRYEFQEFRPRTLTTERWRDREALLTSLMHLMHDDVAESERVENARKLRVAGLVTKARAICDEYGVSVEFRTSYVVFRQGQARLWRDAAACAGTPQAELVAKLAALHQESPELVGTGEILPTAVLRAMLDDQLLCPECWADADGEVDCLVYGGTCSDCGKTLGKPL